MNQAPPDVVSVADLARTLKRSVEGVTGRHWVDGEIASLKRAASGHVYFTLRDSREDAALECVMYRMDALAARSHLTEGAHVQVWGRATLWAPRGRLQMVLSKVRPVGRGTLLEQLERLKAKLRQEGLFERARKRPLPVAPAVVGVITSSHGAALHDIRKVAFARGRVVLVLAPATVQGEGAPNSLLSALNQLERHPAIEVLIIGRGGGSSEDLMAFNDERVVRRIASFRVPTVSAVGHEVDVTLADLVADVRAATPSQAAELVVPQWSARQAELNNLVRQMRRAVAMRLAEERTIHDGMRSRISDPRFVIAQRQQDIDELQLRAERVMRRAMSAARSERETLQQRLARRHPRLVVVEARSSLQPLVARATRAMLGRVQQLRAVATPHRAACVAALRLRLHSEQSQLRSHNRTLNALSPLTVLGRGYAIVRSSEGQVISRAQAVRRGQALDILLHEGSVQAEVTASQPRVDAGSAGEQ